MTNTLTSAPVAPLLDRLFAQADEASTALRAMAAELPPGELARLMQSKTDYIDFYSRLKDQPLPVSRATGALLYMLARHAGAREIVEYGTSFGLSTLHLAAALRDNGGGRLITCEFEPSKVERARAEPRGGRPHRPRRNPRRRRAADAARGPARGDRPGAARWREGALSRDPRPAREPAAAGRVDRRRQRRRQPRVPGAACARRRAATCRRRSPRTSSCRCASADSGRIHAARVVARRAAHQLAEVRDEVGLVEVAQVLRERGPRDGSPACTRATASCMR